MEAPERIKPTGPADYLEVMTKVVFQTGISWKVVESKWPGIKDAFRDFDPEIVANLNAIDQDTLVGDARIIRNRRKVEAIVGNARLILDLDKEYGGFQKYLRSHANFEALLKDLKKRFKFVGNIGAYYFLWVVGEEVPPHEEFTASH